MVLTFPDLVKAKPKPFKFHNFLASKPGFLSIVDDVWKKEINGHTMFNVVSKLKLLKKPIRRLSFEQGNLFEKVKKLKIELEKVQEAVVKDSGKYELRDEEAVYVKAYKEALIDEELFLKQKSKVEWLKEGDQNSKFFHKPVKGRNNRNRITSVTDMKGNMYMDNNVADQFVLHFKNVLGCSSITEPIISPETLFTKKISFEDAHHMVRFITDEEIKAALFDIDDDKALGPDGYSSKFFKTAWVTVGPEVCKAIRGVFQNGKMLKELNSAVISLVPKVSVPQKVSDYRPIACCNVLYKCISKVIINRIKGVLDDIVDENQSAFIHGRQISDNILLTQELMINYHKKTGPPKCAFKIDIQKAYDSVEWPFLKNCLLSFGFHPMMIRRKIVEEDGFKYHWRCEDVELSHLCFADDLFMFCRGDKQSALILKSALLEFSGVSGLVASMEKSSSFFSNVKPSVKFEISEVLPFVEGSLPIRYLGIPLLATRLYRRDCMSSMFILPISVNVDIERLLRDFLWCQGEFKRGKAKVNWKDVCKTKAKGGLGIKILHTWNIALMSKHAWNIVSGKNSIWANWVAKVKLKKRNFWDFKAPDDSCWSWKKIMQNRKLICDFIVKKISDGKQTSAWYDNWHPKGPLCNFISYRDLYEADYNKNEVVADIVVNYEWNVPELWKLKFKDLFDLPTPLLIADRKDRCLWKSKSGKTSNFSVKQDWKDISDDWDDAKWSKLVWFSQCIPRHSFIMWVALHGKLRTRDKFMRVESNENLKCPFCNVCKDNHNHLFFERDYPKVVWHELKSLARLDHAPNLLTDIVPYMLSRPINKSVWSIIQRLVFGACVYCIWQERNLRLYQDKSTPVVALVDYIKNLVRLKLLGLTIKNSNQVKLAAEMWNVNLGRNVNDGVKTLLLELLDYVHIVIGSTFGLWRYKVCLGRVCNMMETLVGVQGYGGTTLFFKGDIRMENYLTLFLSTFIELSLSFQGEMDVYDLRIIPMKVIDSPGCHDDPQLSSFCVIKKLESSLAFLDDLGLYCFYCIVMGQACIWYCVMGYIGFWYYFWVIFTACAFAVLLWVFSAGLYWVWYSFGLDSYYFVYCSLWRHLYGVNDGKCEWADLQYGYRLHCMMIDAEFKTKYDEDCIVFSYSLIPSSSSSSSSTTIDLHRKLGSWGFLYNRILLIALYTSLVLVS
ncbi:uncharacterized protein [Rutidosis leptorrhynchoides]|uniref:uncharacterized protein n=1 Tax=Rutidosis leptorrhynchoides TaxID=125765 RepID=UPI003A99F587